MMKRALLAFMKLKNWLCHLFSKIGLNTEENLLRVDSKLSKLRVMEIEERECPQKGRKTSETGLRFSQSSHILNKGGERVCVFWYIL